MTFSSEKMSIFTAKISDELFCFLSLTRFFGFSLSFPRFSVSFTMLNVLYDPFLTRTTTISENNSFMTPFFTLIVLSRAADNTTPQNIGETDAWAVPHLKFWERDSPPRSPPLSGVEFSLLWSHSILELFQTLC